MEGRREEVEDGRAGMVPGNSEMLERLGGDDVVVAGADGEAAARDDECDEARETGGMAGSRRGAADRADATERGMCRVLYEDVGEEEGDSCGEKDGLATKDERVDEP